MKLIKKLLKSKTILFNMFVVALGIVEYNLHLFYMQLGENYGFVFIAIAIINAWLRMITVESIHDKNN